MKPTPGPWFNDGERETVDMPIVHISGPNGKPVCDVWSTMTDITPDEEFATDGYVLQPEDHANAHLIVASCNAIQSAAEKLGVDPVALAEGLQGGKLADAFEASRSIVAWLESEDSGPDYGSLTRDTHPEGEQIWRQWWDRNIGLCDQALKQARAALSLLRPEKTR